MIIVLCVEALAADTITPSQVLDIFGQTENVQSAAFAAC
jgi:hypothetical protein